MKQPKDYAEHKEVVDRWRRENSELRVQLDQARAHNLRMTIATALAAYLCGLLTMWGVQ